VVLLDFILTLLVVVVNREGDEELKTKHLDFKTITSTKKDGVLKKLLHKYMLCFNQAKVGLVIGTAGGNILELMNPHFAEMHGYTVQELTGRPVAEVFASEYRAELLRITELIHETGHYTYESKHVKKDGTIFPVLISAAVVYDEKQIPKYRVFNVIDLSEIKNKEEKIRELYIRTEMLVRASLTAWVLRKG